MPSLWKSSSSTRRPSPGHQSIRGKISGPIPILSPTDDDFPIRNSGPGIASTTKDEELPIRDPGSGIASMTPLPEETDSELLHPQQDLEQEQEQQQQEQTTPPPDIAAIATHISHADVAQSASPEAPSHPPPPPPSSSPPLRVKTPPQRHSPPRNSPQRISPRRNNPSSTLRYSTVSEAPTGLTGRSKDGAPQRKKSTLRAALGKLFGRRKKGSGSQGSSSTIGRMSGMITSSQHRSDPSALNRSKTERSASLPITEYDRALRSHSIGPHDMTAIEVARNSLQGEVGPSRARAATTTSRLFIHPRGDSEWAGLTPRPASTHGRGSRLIIPGQEDPSEIGRAITSDSGGAGGAGGRRRSRSLSGLNDIAGGGLGQRRRSDEIRYWRESYDRGFFSPMSSNAPDETEGDNDDTGGVDVSAPGSPATDRPPKTPPQPFNFGSLTNEMVGMKITQAASLDSRIGGLETRMLKLERVVNQLCHSVPGFKTPLTETPRRGGESPHVGVTSDPSSFMYSTAAAPPMIPAIYQTISNEIGVSSSRYSSSRQSVETDGQSHLSFGEAPTFIGSLYPPSSSATQAQSLTATAPAITPANRPDSNSTVRGAASLPTMGKDTGDESGGDHAARLTRQLEEERVTRQALEAQVKKLSDRLNSLSTTMYALVRDPARSRSQEHLQPIPSPASQPRTVPGLPQNPAQKSLKTRSAFDDDSDVEKTQLRSGGAGDQADEEDDHEDLETPREEEEDHPRYGAFGEELRDDDEDDPKRKKAARTLSLSQLTLGKGAQLQI